MFLKVSLLLLSVALFGQIHEVAHFNEIVKYSGPDTILLLDIDETLIIPVQMLGGDAWFEYRLKSHQNEQDCKAPLEKTLAEWEAIRHLSKMKLAEPDIASVLKELQSQKVSVMGLTVQGLALATRTILQLNEQGIELFPSSPFAQDLCFQVEGHTILFRQGILFTSGKSKGKAFFLFCEQIGLEPKRVVAIDDKLSHLESLEKEAEKRGVDFVGLRYSFPDARIHSFSPEIANYQLFHSTFTHILSDEEAEKQLKESEIE